VDFITANDLQLHDTGFRLLPVTLTH